MDDRTGQKLAKLARARIRDGGALWVDAWNARPTGRARVTNLRWYPRAQHMAVQYLNGWTTASEGQLAEIADELGVQI